MEELGKHGGTMTPEEREQLLRLAASIKRTRERPSRAQTKEERIAALEFALELAGQRIEAIVKKGVA